MEQEQQTTQPGLEANIRRIMLFGKEAQFPNATADPAPFIAYHGQRLYITKMSLGTKGELVIQIDDDGPPNTTVTLPTPGPTKASASLQIGKLGYKDSTVVDIDAYSGAPLVLTAALGLDQNLFDPVVTPAVSLWRAPHARVEFPAYVAVRTSATTVEMRWIDGALETDHSASLSARIIPPATGGQVMGPWGLETP